MTLLAGVSDALRKKLGKWVKTKEEVAGLHFEGVVARKGD